MAKTKDVKACCGHIIIVDTSDEACAQFGPHTGERKFKHGDRIILDVPCFKSVGVVEGVATGCLRCCDDDALVLWCTFDKEKGAASYCNPLKEGELTFAP